MNTLTELNIARDTCLRKLSTFTLKRTYQSLAEWESSGLAAKYEEQNKNIAKWQRILSIINQKMYSITEEIATCETIPS